MEKGEEESTTILPLLEWILTVWYLRDKESLHILPAHIIEHKNIYKMVQTAR